MARLGSCAFFPENPGMKACATTESARYNQSWRVSWTIAGLARVHRKVEKGWREESPDTTLREQSRVARLVTPGDAARTGYFTESATENIPPAERIPVIARRKTFGTSSNGTQRR